MKLYNGDCLELMKLIADKSIDAIITDPPYGTTACKWDSVIPFEPMWKQLNRIIKNNGAIVLFGSEPFSSALRMSNIKNYKYDLIWEKSKCGSPFTAKYKPLTKHENISIFCESKTTYNPQMTEGKPYKRISKKGKNNMCFGAKDNFKYGSLDGKRYPNSVLKFSQKWRRQDQIHPTQKPIKLMEYLIKTYTNENDTVLDFTMGSGTTGVSCYNTNRDFIGIEQDKNYFQIAEQRIKEKTKQIKLF
tara:strand:- start:65 stop:802 length:738 start_codon:yes stop_codon:yes gene_type:complete